MSIVAGLIGGEDDVAPALLEVISSASPARADFYGLAASSGSEGYTVTPSFPGVNGAIALAFKLIKVEPNDGPQPLFQNGQATALLGRSMSSVPGVLALADSVRGEGNEGLTKFLTKFSGPYAVVVAGERSLLCCRDVLGVVPLYYGVKDGLACVASNIKTVRRLGMEARRVEPGRVMELMPGNVKETKVRRVNRPKEVPVAIDEAVDTLSTNLCEAAERAVGASTHPVLAFSGGIDSTLLAFYLQRSGVRPLLSCIASEGSHDSVAAEESADALNLPLRVREIKDKDVEGALDSVLASVEEANPVNVGITLPLYFVAEGAVSEGRRIVISGNMSDELFGGYARYIEVYRRQGADSVREVMFRDVEHAHEFNFERDWKVCADLGAELRLPYTDPKLVDYALSLPLDLKLPYGGVGPRKMVLRKLASKLGFPDEISDRPKKAAQYSSGVHKILERLARSKGLSLSGYLHQRLEALGGELIATTG